MSRLARSDADGLLPVIVGTIAWAVALVALILLRDSLADSGNTWWIGVAVVGVLTGLGVLLFLRWRRRRQSAG